MLELGFVRSNWDFVLERLKARGVDVNVMFFGIDLLERDRRNAIAKLEELQADRNQKSEQIARKKRNGENIELEVAMLSHVRGDIAERDRQVEAYNSRLQKWLQGLPNLPMDSVPVGAGEADNVCVKTWGAKPEFGFAARPHWGDRRGVGDPGF